MSWGVKLGRRRGKGRERSHLSLPNGDSLDKHSTGAAARLPLPLFREELASLSLKRNSSSRPLRLPASLSPATWRAISLSFHSFFLLSFYFLLVLIFPRPSFHPSFLDSSSVRHRFFFPFFSLRVVTKLGQKKSCFPSK